MAEEWKGFGVGFLAFFRLGFDGFHGGIVGFLGDFTSVFFWATGRNFGFPAGSGLRRSGKLILGISGGSFKIH